MKFGFKNNSKRRKNSKQNRIYYKNTRHIKNKLKFGIKNNNKEKILSKAKYNQFNIALQKILEHINDTMWRKLT